MRFLLPFVFLASASSVSADICASTMHTYLVPIEVKELICCVPNGPDFPDTAAPPDADTGPSIQQPTAEGQTGVFAPTDSTDQTQTDVLQSAPQLFGNLDSPLCKPRDELTPIESITLQTDPTGGGACRGVEEVLYAACSCTLNCNGSMVCGELCPATRVDGVISGFFPADIDATDPTGVFFGQNKSYLVLTTRTPCNSASGCDGDFDGTFEDPSPFD